MERHLLIFRPELDVFLNVSFRSQASACKPGVWFEEKRLHGIAIGDERIRHRTANPKGKDKADNLNSVAHEHGSQDLRAES